MILQRETTDIDPAILDRRVSGPGITPGSTFRDVVGSAEHSVLLVFLRHYG
jgi:hypothetical protein